MQSKLRVCFVSSYPPNHARLSEYAQSLVGEIAARPSVAKITILADTVDTSKASAAVGSKVEVMRVWSPDRPLSFMLLLWRIMLLRPDVVHFNLHFQSFGRSRVSNFLGFNLVPCCRLLGFKTVVTLHNLGQMIDLRKVNVKPSAINAIGILIATKLVLHASRTVVAVQSYARFLRAYYGNRRVMFIPHGASVSNCSFRDGGENVVLMFGHMGPSKGLPVLLEAFELMLKGRSDVRLVVAGGNHPNFPDYLEKFKRMHHRNVEFLGYLEAKDLSGVFCSADVVVLPYLTATGTSGVFHLACGYGKPVVASALPEICELVEDGASAVLVPSGDTGALREGIIRVLDDKVYAQSIGRRNHGFAEREDWSIIAAAYERLYLQVWNLEN